jgi:integrase
MDLIPFLKSVWNASSDYFKEVALSRGRPISAGRIRDGQDLIRLHVEKFPQFQSLPLSALSSSLIKEFMRWEADRGVSPCMIRRTLCAMRIAVRYAFNREYIQVDPFARVAMPAPALNKRGCLTRKEALAILSAPVSCLPHRVSILLGMLAGLRVGEVRGLLWEDIDFENLIISVRHNFQNFEGMKSPKNDSFGTVPIASPLAKLLHEWHDVSGNPVSGFVMPGKKGMPYSVAYFNRVLKTELAAIGISFEEKQKRHLTFHSLRHTFVSLGRLSGMRDIELQGLTRHKNAATMFQYSHAEEMTETDKGLPLLESLIAGNVV